MVVDTCAYFDFGSSGSVRINASKKSIYVTIFVTILAGTMVIRIEDLISSELQECVSEELFVAELSVGLPKITSIPLPSNKSYPTLTVSNREPAKYEEQMNS